MKQTSSEDGVAAAAIVVGGGCCGVDRSSGGDGVMVCEMVCVEWKQPSPLLKWSITDDAAVEVVQSEIVDVENSEKRTMTTMLGRTEAERSWENSALLMIPSPSKTRMTMVKMTLN